MRRATFVVATSGTDVVVIAGATLIAGSPRGRTVLLGALVGGGVVASCFAFFETVIQVNPILQLGLRMGSPVAQQWTSVARRLGLARAAAGFSHPILLGTFLGLSMLATVEMARRGRLKEGRAVWLVGVQLLAQLSTLSRGPMVATVSALALWTVGARPMKVWRRAVVLVVLVTCIVVAVVAIVLQEQVESLVTPSGQTEIGATSQHRVDLIKALGPAIRQTSPFGYTDPQGSKQSQTFVSLDNEALYLIVTRGVVGLAAFAVLLFGPSAIAVTRLRQTFADKIFPLVTLVYVAIVSLTVAFFALIVPFLLVTLVLMWALLRREPSAA
jgi:O-antigen ligase